MAKLDPRPAAASSRGKPTRKPARSFAELPPHRLYELLSPTRRGATLDLVGLILAPQTVSQITGVLVEQICERIVGMGIPIDRYMSSTTVLTPDHDALGRMWTKDRGVKESNYVRPPGEDPDYRHSPLFESSTTQTWVELWLPDTPDNRFGIVPELKRDGYIHYLCIPFRLGNDANGWMTMATRSPKGFSEEDFASIALIAPAVARAIDTRVGWTTLDRLLRIYVGDEPHRAILNGNVKRGQVATIQSAILFADMRDSTGHTAEISAAQAVELFNLMFDQLVPPIESRHGEVLKYIGDGLLAIFREDKIGTCDAADRALSAAEDALSALAALNVSRPEQRPIHMGIALHYGEAAYGNVGSGQRLDFTVIGRDIGLASRIGGMNARLDEPLLMSEAFVARLRRPATALGAFPARGFVEPLAVFRPSSLGEPDEP